jgi:hypothetical protein
MIYPHYIALAPSLLARTLAWLLLLAAATLLVDTCWRRFLLSSTTTIIHYGLLFHIFPIHTLFFEFLIRVEILFVIILRIKVFLLF